MFYAPILAAALAAPYFADSLPRRGVLGLPLSPVPAEAVASAGLSPGQGAVAADPVPGLTAAKAGVQKGDIIAEINGKQVQIPSISQLARGLESGKPVTFTVYRAGKRLDLTTNLMPKPTDPGNQNYEVVYSHVVSQGERMRTIITIPRTPGPHPGFMFIQGFSPVSYDFTLEGSTGDVQSLDGPLLFEAANRGFVTLRVEKPGVGDSEGGPFADLDYIRELDIYRQALKQLKSLPQVNPKDVFIFGHSMGGAFGPMIAVEEPVRGIAVYGVAARTWQEYLLNTVRYQGLVGGGTFEAADEEVRQASRLFAQVFAEGKSAAEVKRDIPELSAMADSLMPGGYFNGKTLEFWRQLGEVNFAAYWSKVNTHVLAVRGASDFVTYDVDHKLIADIVNRANPGKGEWAIAPNSDHVFHAFASEPDSMKSFPNGPWSPVFTEMMLDWINRVRSSGPASLR